MNVLVTGATGFIGRALIPRLLRDGHSVSAWVRDVPAARSRVGAEVTLIDAREHGALTRAMVNVDGVINLAGEPVAMTRWTEKRRASLVSSRVQTTRQVVEAMAASPREGRVLVSASAVGFYGDTGDALQDEASPRGPGFLAELCEAWEDAALEARTLGVRVVIPRIGIVLGPEGGALGPMLPAFRAGLGGPIAGGQQWMSWIHLDDMVSLLVTLLTRTQAEGVVNATAPNPVRNGDFAKALGAAVGRPAVVPVPGFALRLALGESASVVTSGQRVESRAAALGVEFRFPHLKGALDDILGLRGTVDMQRRGPPGPPRDGGPPDQARYELRQSALLDAPLQQVFPFFARADNLGLITPVWTAFRILQQPQVVSEGALIDYTIRVSGVPLGWRTRIAIWEPPTEHAHNARFVDTMERGPYAIWWHEHRFEAVGQKTRMLDTVSYSMPLGPLGWLVHWLQVSSMLRRIFGFRFSVMRARFGIATELSTHTGPSAPTGA